MASRMIGRAQCFACGFESAHVKQREEEGKRPYLYCPECFATYHTKTDRQVADLARKTRPAGQAAAPAPSGGLFAGVFG